MNTYGQAHTQTHTQGNLINNGWQPKSQIKEIKCVSLVMKEACFLPRDNNFIWTHTHTYSLYKHTHTHGDLDTHIFKRYQHSSNRAIPLVQACSKQSRTQCHDLKFDTKRMFSRALKKNVEVGCHAKQSRERKDCFQTFPMHQAIKMTFVCRLLALVLGHIANTWNYMLCPSMI